METLAFGLVALVLLYVLGLVGTIRKTVAVADKSLDTFNEVSGRKLDEMNVSSKYDHGVKMGKLKAKIESGKRPVSTLADVEALLAGGTPKTTSAKTPA